MADSVKTTNYNRLLDKGLIPQNLKLSDDDREVINGLSADEVDTLLSIARRLRFNRPLVFPHPGGLVKFF